MKKNVVYIGTGVIILTVIIGTGLFLYSRNFNKNNSNESGLEDNSTHLETSEDVNVIKENIKTALGLDNTDFEVLEYDEIEESLENLNIGFEAKIEFNSTKIDSIIDSIQNREWEVFPRNTQSIYTEEVNSVYEEWTGQRGNITAKNIYKLVSSKFRDDIEMIDENSYYSIGELCYWDCGNGKYNMLIKYEELYLSDSEDGNLKKQEIEHEISSILGLKDTKYKLIDYEREIIDYAKIFEKYKSIGVYEACVYKINYYEVHKEDYDTRNVLEERSFAFEIEEEQIENLRNEITQAGWIEYLSEDIAWADVLYKEYCDSLEADNVKKENIYIYDKTNCDYTINKNTDKVCGSIYFDYFEGDLQVAIQYFEFGQKNK